MFVRWAKTQGTRRKAQSTYFALLNDLIPISVFMLLFSVKILDSFVDFSVCARYSLAAFQLTVFLVCAERPIAFFLLTAIRISHSSIVKSYAIHFSHFSLHEPQIFPICALNPLVMRAASFIYVSMSMFNVFHFAIRRRDIESEFRL